MIEMRYDATFTKDEDDISKSHTCADCKIRYERASKIAVALF